jgi:hypothetical protein
MNDVFNDPPELHLLALALVSRFPDLPQSPSGRN